MADLVIVNKVCFIAVFLWKNSELLLLLMMMQADGDLIIPARRAKIEYISALKLLSRTGRSWAPLVCASFSFFRIVTG